MTLVQPGAAAGLPADLTQTVVHLTQTAIAASDLTDGVTPTLEHLVRSTAAVGSAFFQVGGGSLAYHVRAATGEMPATPGMQAIAAHGLPADTPLMRALEVAPAPMFFPDTGTSPVTAGFPDLGVASLAAAPVRDGQGRLLGAFLMHTFTPHEWAPWEADLFTLVAGTIASLAGRLTAEEAARAAREEALRALGLALEARDRETHGHTDRVAGLAVRLATHLGWDDARVRALRWGAYLHDIGKIAIPDAVLLKPGPFTPDERTVMETHVQAGVSFATALTFLPAVALAVIHDHHERWDGQGYPTGKRGQEITVEGRLFALCDVYDALTSARPYKRAWTHGEAMDELRAQAGRQFDPALVDAFHEMMAALN
ncbi:putative nucleotidyltransferase with HDIG domain [Deinococcus metalli]|uniref:Phosphohydrolase n=1 Tax=Deinococcus metalli TaxID=1141878 RepID=A0A7W8NRX5_9DEIO|nr:HD-GYP domain-containing protein [Deinococcus metalli]MBB5376567.1 putative nucleotidyltransferase with HDIG domain [Deinococcus metalli]GHF43080.1 phosphohydrolase [Deinococcus metalli]